MVLWENSVSYSPFIVEGIPSILYLLISGTFPQNGHGNRFMKATILLVLFFRFDSTFKGVLS